MFIMEMLAVSCGLKSFGTICILGGGDSTQFAWGNAVYVGNVEIIDVRKYKKVPISVWHSVGQSHNHRLSVG
jgi:hypothetical protein